MKGTIFFFSHIPSVFECIWHIFPFLLINQPIFTPMSITYSEFISALRNNIDISVKCIKLPCSVEKYFFNPHVIISY